MSALITGGVRHPSATQCTTRLLASLLPTGDSPAVAAIAPLETALDRAPFPTLVAITEHVSGVLPLLDHFENRTHPTIDASRRGDLPTALAVFTPSVDLVAPPPGVRARWSTGTAVLDGRFRFSSAAAGASLVAAAVGDDLRLCLVAHDGPGVRISAGPDGGWADLTGSVIDADLVSRPVSWDNAPLARAVDEFAWAYATIAHQHAGNVLAMLRRALAATEVGGEPFRTSQLLSHDLTRIDIELSLLAAAARFGPGFRSEPPGGVAVSAVLTACTELMHRAARTTADFVTELGLPPASVGDLPLSAASAHFGGRRMVTAELTRRMGLLAELH